MINLGVAAGQWAAGGSEHAAVAMLMGPLAFSTEMSLRTQLVGAGPERCRRGRLALNIGRLPCSAGGCRPVRCPDPPAQHSILFVNLLIMRAVNLLIHQLVHEVACRYDRAAFKFHCGTQAATGFGTL